MNKKAFMCMLMVTTLTLVGCGKNEKKAFQTKDGKMISYSSVNELPDDDYYVKKKNGDINPTLKQGVESDGSFAWYTDYDKLVPTLTDKDEIIYVSSSNRPTGFSFQRMENQGKTLGIRFDIQVEQHGDTEINKFSFPSSDEGYNPTSPVGSVVKKALGENTQNVVITSINDKKISPLMFTEEGFMKGLTPNAMYKLGFYQGTKYKEVDIKSDTRVLTQFDTAYATNSYVETKKGYFRILIPDEMPSGYYLVGENSDGEKSGGGLGLFKYVKTKKTVNNK